MTHLRHSAAKFAVMHNSAPPERGILKFT